jgi:histidinol-phosphate aminotransferase
MAQRPHFADPNKGIHIDANENPLGPCEPARQAMIDIVPRGGRYLMGMEEDLTSTFAKMEGLSPDSVMAFAGSSEPLHYTVLTFTGAGKPLVVADPGYEAPMWAAKIAGAEVVKVPLADPKGAASHDIKAMLAASTTPGVIYICNPNNPTGTCTPRQDIEYAVANAPKDTILLIDEAYIHLCDAPRSLDFVKEGKNVIVLRTFSKLYGMAGIRMGFAIGRPDLLKKLEDYGQSPMPITGMIAAQASLMDSQLVPTRKKLIADTRNNTFAWLTANNYSFIPSQSNCFMIDVKRPGVQIRQLMAQDGVHIGRSWAIWPTYVRVTVGLPSEMDAFKTSFKKAMDTPATAFNEDLRSRRNRDGLFA